MRLKMSALSSMRPTMDLMKASAKTSLKFSMGFARAWATSWGSPSQVASI